MLNGRALPYTTEFDVTVPLDTPAAVIPVARIKGPVLLDCGGADVVWDSCSYADAIMAELNNADDRWTHQLLTYRDAGHGVNGLVPYEPAMLASEFSGFPSSNQLASANQWPKVLAFLAANS